MTDLSPETKQAIETASINFMLCIVAMIGLAIIASIGLGLWKLVSLWGRWLLG